MTSRHVMASQQHWQLCYFFNSLLRLTSKKTSMISAIHLLWDQSKKTPKFWICGLFVRGNHGGGFPTQRAITVISCRHHVACSPHRRIYFIIGHLFHWATVTRMCRHMISASAARWPARCSYGMCVRLAANTFTTQQWQDMSGVRTYTWERWKIGKYRSLFINFVSRM